MIARLSRLFMRLVDWQMGTEHWAYVVDGRYLDDPEGLFRSASVERIRPNALNFPMSPDVDIETTNYELVARPNTFGNRITGRQREFFGRVELRNDELYIIGRYTFTKGIQAAYVFFTLCLLLVALSPGPLIFLQFYEESRVLEQIEASVFATAFMSIGAALIFAFSVLVGWIGTLFSPGGAALQAYLSAMTLGGRLERAGTS